jgi:ankyrin repeat protein
MVGLVLIIHLSPCFSSEPNVPNEEYQAPSSAQSTQLQDPAKEPQEVEIQQKAEQPVAIKNELNRQLLHLASSAGTTFMKTLYINNLLSEGADINAVDEYGLTSLHHAAQWGDKDIITLLLANGATVDCKDNAGRTPLHYATGAAQQSFVEIVALLLDNDASVDAQDNIGWTPLHYAALKRDKSVVGLLVAKGADISIVNNRGETVYSWIHERASFEARHAMGVPHELVNEYSEIEKLLRVDSWVYAVALNGKDSNPGTLEQPFKTINAALEIVGPGNVIYIRGGRYRCGHSIRLDKSGAQGNPICLKAYPGETPILDFSDVRGSSLFVSGAYWHIKGLVVVNGYYGVRVMGPGARHNILEQVTVSANGWGGLIIRDGAAYNIVLNCDSYKNFDPESNGDTCDGFSVAFFVGQGNTFIGNRSWNNSDDGYDCWRSGNAVRFERCYAWNNGENIWNHPFFFGNGNGFKLGRGTGRHLLVGCLSWGHSLTGATLNSNTSGSTLRNCTFWDNKTNYYFEWSGWPEEGRSNSVFINNLSYEGHGRDKIYREATAQNNSWNSDLGLVLADDDFLSFDDSMMSVPRNPDGGIPRNDFLKLAPGSAAIDKGTDIGMPFVGRKPDLGAFEYDPNETSEGYVKMLHQAVRDHDLRQIEQLLAQGAGINDKDWLGYTPLHWAIYFGYPDLVELLISKGADPNIQSDTGQSSLEIAQAMTFPEEKYDFIGLISLLRKHGAKAGDMN